MLSNFGLHMNQKGFADAGNKGRDIFFIKDGKLFQLYTGHNGIPQESVYILVNKTFFIDQIAETFRFMK